MYYVILNHTNPTVSLMVDGWGCIIKFKFLKAAIQAGEGAVNDGDAWEYLVVKEIER